MDVDKDPFSEESFRAFVESLPPITRLEEVPYSFAVYRSEVHLVEFYFPTFESFSQASQAFLENAIKFHFYVANHSFPVPLLGHDRLRFLFFVFVTEVMGLVPLFSDFVVSFLNRINATHFAVLSHISRNERGGGGRFVRITVVAGLRLFWLHVYLRPLFPLCWSAFCSLPSVLLTYLSEVERAAVAVLTTRRLRNMVDLCATSTYAQWQANQRQVVNVSSLFGSSNEAMGDVTTGLHSSRTKEVANEEVPCRSEKAMENSLRQGVEPMEEEKEERPCVRQGARSSTYEGLTRTIRFCTLLLYEALSGLQGVGALAGSTEELAAARRTIRELEEALSANNAMIFEMLHVGFIRIGSSGADTSGVKQEPTLPPSPLPGFDPLFGKSKEEEDSKDDQF
ncbi:uncharacterized protein G2W53_004255 [Senna tora]|uniref:Uncharacterized protein n=1 Tax=Senna tora TaxID=362788 RepID=A0A834XCQ1_9FABA|nr:uncharacterized protein G2W53_004255 [Senna tora]